MASSWALIISLSLFRSLSLESEWGCVYPTFTLKISSSDAADTGSFRPLSSSSSTVRSPEMALRISGPMSCNVRRPAYTQTKRPEVLHLLWNNTVTNMLLLLTKPWNKASVLTHYIYYIPPHNFSIMLWSIEVTIWKIYCCLLNVMTV